VSTPVPPSEPAPSGRSEPREEIAIAVVRHQDRYLIGLRPEGVPLAGYWEFPGGKVEAGETPAAAAERECLEETGLAVRATCELAPADYDYAHAAVRLHFFACEPVTSELPPLPDRFRWVSCDELDRYQFPPANDALLDSLRSQG
jgi:mutator protein MutT